MTFYWVFDYEKLFVILLQVNINTKQHNKMYQTYQKKKKSFIVYSRIILREVFLVVNEEG